MTEFLHELIKKQNMNQLISEMVDEASDPWRYSEPPPPFTGDIPIPPNPYMQRGPY
jgi:hypothetical protein